MKAGPKFRFAPYFKLVGGAVLVTGVAIFFARKQGANFEDVLRHIRDIPLPILFLVLGADLAQLFCMTLRTHILLPSHHKISFFTVCRAVSVGQVTNTFLPARAGDILKVVMLGQGDAATKLPIMTITGVLIAEKVVDIVTFVLMLFLTGAVFLPQMEFSLPQSMRHLGIGTLVILALGGVWQFYLKKKLLTLRERILEFVEGLKGLVHPKQILGSALVGFGAWTMECLAVKWLVVSQGVPLEIPQAMFVLFLLNLAISVPVSIANMGPFEASMVFALGKFNVPISTAIAVATVHHAMQILTYTLWAGALASVHFVRTRLSDRAR